MEQKLKLSDSCFPIYIDNGILIRDTDRFYRITGEAASIIRKIFPYFDGKYSMYEILKKFPIEEWEVIQNAIISLLEQKILVSIDLASNKEVYSSLKESLSRYRIKWKDAEAKFKDSHVTVIGSGVLLADSASTLLSLGIQNLNLVWLDNWEVTKDDVTLLNGKFSELIGSNGNNGLKTLLESSFPSANIKQSFILEDLKQLGNEIKRSTVVVLATQIDNPRLPLMINNLCNSYNVPWLVVKTRGFKVELGPFVVPGETACYDCFISRRMANMRFPEEYRIYIENICEINEFKLPRITELTSIGVSVASQMIATEVFKFLLKDITWEPPRSLGKFIEFDLFGFEFEQSAVLKLPRCFSCGRLKGDRPTIKYWMEPYPGQVELEGSTTNVKTELI